MQQDQIQLPQTLAKQTNLIRKTAIQTFQPMIAKIQQHIAYLLAQTSRLRQRNQLLERTVMDHHNINTAITDIRSDIDKLEDKLSQSNKDHYAEAMNVKTQIVGIAVDIQKINEVIKNKQKLIKQLYEKNSEQSNKIQKNSSEFKEIVEESAKQIAEIQSKNYKLEYSNQSFQQYAREAIKKLNTAIYDKQTKIQQNSQKLELYLTQREQIRKVIEDIWKKVDKTIDIQRYEKEWKIIRMENEEMKKQNKKMIDQALPPEVRQFLPQMMQRMEEIRKVNSLEISFHQHKYKTDQFQIEEKAAVSFLQKQVQQIQLRSQQIRIQLIEKTTSFATSLSSKLQLGKDDASQTIKNLQNQITQLIHTKQKQLKQSIETLIDRNNQKIYKIIINLIPKQQKQSYNQMKQFLPLLQSTKKQLLQRCDRITQLSKGLQLKLQAFNNRIVKIKGDVNVEIQNLKKKNKSIDNSIMIIANHFKNLGKVISAYCQFFLIQYSLSVDLLDKQVYVTYYDGIVYERTQTQNQICYRKMKITKEQLKRAAFSQLIQLTDDLISAEQYDFMLIKENKPSKQFKLIKQAIFLSYLNVPQIGNRRKQRKLSVKVKQTPTQNKLPTIDQNTSKTIQLPATISQAPKQVFSQTLTTDFTNIHKKEKEKSYRGRYSQNK